MTALVYNQDTEFKAAVKTVILQLFFWSEGGNLDSSLLPLLRSQRAHQTSTRTATSWSKGSLATTRRASHVKRPSITPSLASTAAAAAACLSSAGPCPSLSSCLCRAGPGWPPDPPSPAPCACAHARERAGKALLLFWWGGCCLSLTLSLSLGVWDSSDWGEVSGSCVC